MIPDFRRFTQKHSRKIFYPELTTEHFLLNRDKEKRKCKPTAKRKRFFTYAYAKL